MPLSQFVTYDYLHTMSQIHAKEEAGGFAVKVYFLIISESSRDSSIKEQAIDKFNARMSQYSVLLYGQ